MKKIVMIIAALTMAVSCLEKSTFSQSNTLWATFEYTDAQYTELFGTDSLYYNDQYCFFGWDLMAFYHQVDKDTKDFEGGLMLSYLSIPESGVTEGLSNNEYRANTKVSKNKINTYIVFHQTDRMPEHDMKFTFEASGDATGMCVMTSCLVNNTVAVADAVVKQFVPGDKLILKASGYLDGKQTGTAEIVLAEKASPKDSIISKWTKFDLSKLGTIDNVDFEIIIPEGKEIPQTVCIDEVVANVSLTY